MVSEHFPGPELWATIFYFCRFFFFRSRKKRATVFSKFSLYFCAKFSKKSCRSDFLSEKHLSWKKKSAETESRKSRYWSFKICNFSGFFPRTVAWFFYISVAARGRICLKKVQIWFPLTISLNFKKQSAETKSGKWSYEYFKFNSFSGFLRKRRDFLQ